MRLRGFHSNNSSSTASNTAAIGHEPERTTSNAAQASLNKSFAKTNLQVGGDVQFEKLTSDAFNINPVTGARSLRRPRVPSNARFTQGGAFAQLAPKKPRMREMSQMSTNPSSGSGAMFCRAGAGGTGS